MPPPPTTTMVSVQARRDLEEKEYRRTIKKVERLTLAGDVDELRARLSPNAKLSNRFEKEKWAEAIAVAQTSTSLRNLPIVKMLGRVYEGHELQQRLRNTVLLEAARAAHIEFTQEALSWPGETASVISSCLVASCNKHEKDACELLLASVKDPCAVILAMAISGRLEKDDAYGVSDLTRTCFDRLLGGLTSEQLQSVSQNLFDTDAAWVSGRVHELKTARDARSLNEATPVAPFRKSSSRL